MQDLPLDYYIYSSFTENPSNQCLVHAGAECKACLAACDNSGYAGVGGFYTGSARGAWFSVSGFRGLGVWGFKGFRGSGV